MTIVAETPNDAIRIAAEQALKEIKTDHESASLTYREEILARSYMLGTVRAIHHILFTGEPEAGEEFFRALKRRMDLSIMRSPHCRIIETAFKTDANCLSTTTQLGISPTSKFDTSLLQEPDFTSGKENDEDRFECSHTSNEKKGDRARHSGGWAVLGLSLLLLLLIAVQKMLCRRSVSVDTKEAIARMYLTRHYKCYLSEVSRREVENGMDFEFQNDNHRYNILVDDDGYIRSWRKVE
jgi:hypothetical protein